MPRRGSRAQFLRDIVARDMEELSEVVDEEVHPEDVRPGGRWEEFYSSRWKKLSQLSTEELTQLASGAGIESNNVGRPRLMADHVVQIERLMRVTGRGVSDACRWLANLPHQPSAPTLARRYYRAKEVVPQFRTVG
jgi:hypothetical protein